MLSSAAGSVYELSDGTSRAETFFHFPHLISLSFLKPNGTVTHGPPVAEAWTIRAHGLTVVGAQEDGAVDPILWGSWACRPAPVVLGSVLPGPEGRSGNRQLGKWDKKLSLSVFFLENFLTRSIKIYSSFAGSDPS